MMCWQKATVKAVVAAAVALGLWAALLGGCQSEHGVSPALNRTPERNQRLMAMAAQEAAQIPDPDVRLTRQLNLASQQIRAGWSADGLVTLAASRDTLLSPAGKNLNNHARMSGWVSVSELARKAKDRALAEQACDKALDSLHAITDLAERCQYVMGVANELKFLRGDAAAAEALAEGGPWAKKISAEPQRRQALVAFASALFNLDNYTAGQSVLRQEEDAMWRSDVLASLATPVKPEASATSKMQWQNTYYGQQLQFDQVFEGQQRSKTQSQSP